MPDVLLVDDEPTLRLVMGDTLVAAGHKVVLAADGTRAMEILRTRTFGVVVLDLRLPGISGLNIFRYLRQHHPQMDVILMTAYGSVEDAVVAIREGAVDYLVKPFDPVVLVALVQRVVDHRRLRQELSHARDRLAAHQAQATLVGQSPALVRLLERIDMVARSDAAVLVLGESGTGKELVARAIHDQSTRREGPYIAVNCAALPETLLEAELFGHERGAFTGAVRKRVGRFQDAEGGTLVLDEIGDMSLSSQVKLLRVLQDGSYQAVGSNTSLKTDCRVISITHQNLKKAVAEGRFRQDLYYRIRVLDIELSPLRERRVDLPLLVAHFLRSFTREGQQPPTVSPRAWVVLRQYPFPGNIRELKHAIEHAVVLSGGKEIDVAHLPQDLVDSSGLSTLPEGGIRPLAEVARDFEREYLVWALRQTGGKKGQLADLLGISRKNLWEKLRAHGLNETETESAEGQGDGR